MKLKGVEENVGEFLFDLGVGKPYPNNKGRKIPGWTRLVD